MVAKVLSVLAITILLFGATLAMGQDEPQSDEISTRSIHADLDIEDIRARIKGIEASESLDVGQKTALVGFYQKAIESIEAANFDREKAEEFRQKLPLATQELAGMSQAEAQDTSESSPESDFTALGNDELEVKIAHERSQLAALQGELQERRAGVDLLRNEQTQSAIAAAEAQLAEIESSAQQIGGADNQALSEAKTVALNARKAALRAKINHLDQQRVSYNSRLELALAKARLTEQKKNEYTKRLSALESELRRRTSLRAAASIARTKKMEDAVGAMPASVRVFLEKNREKTSKFLEFSSLTSEILEENVQRMAELARLNSAYARLTEQLRVAGFNITPQLATALHREREELETLAKRFDVPGQDLKQQMINARLEQIELDSLLARDPDSEFAALLADVAQSENSELVDYVEQLVAERFKVLNDLHRAAGEYATALSQIQNLNEQARITFRKYRDLIDERLFWVPSTATVNIADVQLLGEAFISKITPAKMAAGMEKLGAGVADKPLPLLLAAVVIVLLVRLKPLQLRFLEETGRHVGIVQKDRFRFTLQALSVSLLLCLPTLLLMLSFSWMLRLTGEFSALVIGLESAAAIYFLLAIFYQLCRPGGVGEQHFKWRVRTLKTMRSNLRALMIVLVPIAVITNSTATRHGEAASDTLGILSFIVASVAITVFLHRLLKPATADTQEGGSENAEEPASVAAHFLYALAISLPILMAFLAVSGYYYTAVELEGRLFLSACIVSLGVVVFYLVVRILAISERRVRFQQVLSERKAQRERKEEQESAEHAGETIVDNWEDSSFDMETVGEQTRSLARLLVMFLCAWALWSTWSTLLPALGVFDDIVLWQTSTGVEDNYVLKNITLAVAGSAALWVIFTVLAVRNLPGLLDMLLLNRMEFDAGTKYAIVTILKYIIIISGVIAVSYLLGGQWSKLQWLVAAMGVGLGFGLQEIVANFISGILILFERPIRVGDTVTIGGNTGTVTKIRIRATTVLDWDRKEQIIPNKTFITEQLTNWTLTDPVTRIIVRVGVAYDSDIDEVHRLLTEVVQNHGRALKSPAPTVFFVGFGDSSLDFELRVFVSSMVDLMPLTHELYGDVFRQLKKHNIEIPFPQRDIHIRSDAGSAD